MDLPLDEIITVSASASQQGVGKYNPNNLAVYTTEQPAESFGDLGYAIYLDPGTAETDWGSASKTFLMVDAMFDQQPNMTGPGGYVVVIPLKQAVQNLLLSATAASGTYILNFGSEATAAINWNDTVSQIQGKLQALAGLSEITVAGTVGNYNVTFFGVYGPQALMTVTSNSLETSGSVAITVTASTTTEGETLDAGITRTQNLVQWFAGVCTEWVTTLGQSEVLAAAAVIQALNKMFFFVSNAQDDIESGGILQLLTAADLYKSRELYYGDQSDNAEINCLVFAASYMGRAYTVDYTGSKTTITMNLKTLSGVVADPTMNPTIYNLCKTCGADGYASFGGVAKVFSNGANLFWDQVSARLAWIGDLQVAVFNNLSETETKIAQTEDGMTAYKAPIGIVNQQYVTNQYLSPGQWNDPTTFGNQADFLANITQFGFYTFSQPVSQQDEADRVDRLAPLVQVAGKEAGAIQKGNIQVYINP